MDNDEKKCLIRCDRKLDLIVKTLSECMFQPNPQSMALRKKLLQKFNDIQKEFQ